MDSFFGGIDKKLLASSIIGQPIPWYKNGCRIPLLECPMANEDDMKYSILARTTIQTQIPKEKFSPVTWEEALVDIANYEGIPDTRKTIDAWRTVVVLLLTKVVPTNPRMPLSRMPMPALVVPSAGSMGEIMPDDPILLDGELFGGPGSLFNSGRPIFILSKPEISVEYQVSYWKRADIRVQLGDSYE